MGGGGSSPQLARQAEARSSVWGASWVLADHAATGRAALACRAVLPEPRASGVKICSVLAHGLLVPNLEWRLPNPERMSWSRGNCQTNAPALLLSLRLHPLTSTGLIQGPLQSRAMYIAMNIYSAWLAQTLAANKPFRSYRFSPDLNRRYKHCVWTPAHSFGWIFASPAKKQPMTILRRQRRYFCGRWFA